MQLVVYQPPPVLVAYKGWLQRQTHRERIHYDERRTQCHEIVFNIMREFSSTLEAITRARMRIRAKQTGAPCTEPMDALQAADALAPQTSDAELFLLKIAYRQAATLAHPDKGGSTADFQAVVEAYRAKNLGSLHEFVLTRTAPVLKQIAYWLTEVQKPQIDWIEYQSSTEYQIAQLHMQGHSDRARNVTKHLVEATLLHTLAEELS